MIAAEEIERRIREAMPQAEVKVVDTHGGSDHFAAEVIAPEFSGKTLIERHRMVYATVKDVMGGALHALALSTKTPEERGDS
ncbi:MAG: BolA family transcriptional regulator [Acidobacteriota bacterium]